jgi:hypothetical protein
MHVETSRFHGPSGSDGKQTPLSQLINTAAIGRRSLWNDRILRLTSMPFPYLQTGINNQGDINHE